MKRGYARVSTTDQKLDLQIDALEKHGVDKTYSDKMSGAYENRPGLDLLMKELQPGDEVVIWKLNRLGRSLAHLVQLFEEITKRGASLVVLAEGIDTTTPNGRMIAGIMASLAQWQREMIKEAQAAGIEAAKARGNHLGRRPKLNAAKVEAAKTLLAGNTRKEVARILEVDRTTLFRALRGG